MQYTRKVLSNGLRVITVPMPSFESVTVLLMVGAGSRYETKKNSGISHFLEHMAFKGTTTRPTAMAISSIIDGIGGEFNAFTGKESTGYYIKSAVSKVDLAMDVIADMMTHSLLDPKEIEKEKGVIIEELNLYEDTPVRKIGDIYEHLLYGNTPLGWDIGGEKEIIKKITREDFVSYMNSLYSADNMTLVIAGGITVEKSEELAEKYFGSMKQFKTISYLPVVDSQDKPALAIRQKKTEQVHIAIGVRTVPNNHPDRYPLGVFQALMGGGMSSRLFEEIREKRGLAYYVRSASEHYKDCGSFVTSAGLDAKRVEEAIKVIIEQYELVSSGKLPVTSEELSKAKEFMKGHFVLELEDSRSVATHYAGMELLEDKIENPAELLEEIDKVTVDDVNRVAKTYLKKEGLNLAIIGDFPDRQVFEKLLQ